MAQAQNAQAIGPTDPEMLSIGKLSFLASYCPLHKTLPMGLLARFFYPAINNDCVRFFENEAGKTAAALIWARLDDEVSARMLETGMPPTEEEWTSGKTLWFLDLLAPFGHGRIVARNIARNPPREPFYFARINAEGRVRKVVCGDATAHRGGRVTAWHGGMR